MNIVSYFKKLFPEIDETNFDWVCEKIKNLPYKRNQNKKEILYVLKDYGGTCSTKHAFLQVYAEEIGIKNVKLMMAIFMMNARNTPKINSVLVQYKLKEIPEAHNYLKIDGEILDCTRTNSSANDFINDLVEEIEILPNQITDFKVAYHQNFIKNYLAQHLEIPYSLGEFWKIREECISKLSQ